jgi:DNA-binding NarL/FixJ family response regulator
MVAQRGFAATIELQMNESAARRDRRGMRPIVRSQLPNPLLREGLRILIELQPDMELVDLATSGKQAVQAFSRHRPDVTLMDLDLPNREGIAAIREILQIDPATCVLGSMTYEEDESCRHALRAGARSCIAKDRFNQELVPLIRACSPTAN